MFIVMTIMIITLPPGLTHMDRNRQNWSAPAGGAAVWPRWSPLDCEPADEQGRDLDFFRVGFGERGPLVARIADQGRGVVA